MMNLVLLIMKLNIRAGNRIIRSNRIFHFCSRIRKLKVNVILPPFRHLSLLPLSPPLSICHDFLFSPCLLLTCALLSPTHPRKLTRNMISQIPHLLVFISTSPFLSPSLPVPLSISCLPPLWIFPSRLPFLWIRLAELDQGVAWGEEVGSAGGGGGGVVGRGWVRGVGQELAGGWVRELGRGLGEGVRGWVRELGREL